MHSEDRHVTFDTEIFMQFLENDALVHFAIDDVDWFKIPQSWEYRWHAAVLDVNAVEQIKTFSRTKRIFVANLTRKMY